MPVMHEQIHATHLSLLPNQAINVHMWMPKKDQTMFHVKTKL